MNSIPLMFSAVTGLALAALGAALAGSGITGWGLFAVALGILSVTLTSFLSAAPRTMTRVYADTGSYNSAQRR